MKTTIHAAIVVFGIAIVLIAAIRTWRSLEAMQANKTKIEKLLAQDHALQAQLPKRDNRSQPAARNPPKNTPEPSAPDIRADIKNIERFDAQSKLREERRKKDPEAQQRFFAYARVAIRNQYGPFFRMAGLSPDEIEKLTGALLDRTETSYDINALKTSGKYDPNDPAWDALDKDSIATRDSAAREILDDDSFAKFEAYNHEIQAWDYSSHMAVSLSLAGMPVTFEQAQKLEQTIVAATPVDPGSNELQYGKTDWDAVDGAVQAFLTPEQARLFSTACFFNGTDLRWYSQYRDTLNAAIKAEADKSPPP